MNCRKKMCDHCAFRDGSIETSSGDNIQDLLGNCLTKKFYCHETMHQVNKGTEKWLGEFDPNKKRDGSPATMNDHQVCAGFAIMFGEEVNIDASDIPKEDHHFCKEE